MMPRGLFVTGTDTDVGKTWVSAILCAALNQRTPLTYLKPVQAGRPWDQDNVKFLLGAETSVNIHPSLVTLELAASPNRGAEKEGRLLEVSSLREAWQSLPPEPFYVVEGAGGLLVPLNPRESIADLITALDLPTVLVCSSRLGTINHTRLTVEAMRRQGLSCVGLILNGHEDPGLRELLQDLTELPVLLELPQLPELEQGSATRFVESMDSVTLARLQEQLLSPQRGQTSLSSSELRDRDQRFVWHPFTQHGLVQDHPIVESGQGSHLMIDGRPVLDGISSWWVNLFGHAQPEIAQAVADQAKRLEHVLFAGTTHKPAIQVASDLVALVQARKMPAAKVFFSDNGSTAIEVALKMAYQYQAQTGQPQRRRFLALKGAYHGDTFGAMSVGARGGFNEVFEPLFFQTDYLDPFSLEDVEELFAEKGDQFAAFVFEPLVQGAHGMRMYPPENLDHIMALCQKYGVLTVADEIFTGFYRTGTFFAFEQLSHQPDLLCLSKGITGGFLPLSVTLAPEKVFDAFFDPTQMGKAFLHGHSYTANPIACAAACKTLQLLQRPRWLGRIAKLSEDLQRGLERLKDHPRLFNLRRQGLIVAMEYNQTTSEYFSDDFSYRFYQRALQRGALLRPLGNTIYMVPPYCMSSEEVDKLFSIIEEVIDMEDL